MSAQRRLPQQSQASSESLKSRMEGQRNLSERLADYLTGVFGSMIFLALNLLWFSLWIMANLGLFGLGSFDPFPFGLLTMIVSLEAIILAIVVLISQNRAAKIAELREEVDLQVDVITEQEMTKLLQLVTLLLEKQGVDFSNDKELQVMLDPTDTDKLEQDLENQVL